LNREKRNAEGNS